MCYNQGMGKAHEHHTAVPLTDRLLDAAGVVLVSVAAGFALMTHPVVFCTIAMPLVIGALCTLSHRFHRK